MVEAFAQGISLGEGTGRDGTGRDGTGRDGDWGLGRDRVGNRGGGYVSLASQSQLSIFVTCN